MAKFREKHGCFLLEGVKLLLEAVQARAEISDCFLDISLREDAQGRSLVERIVEKGVRPAWVSEQVMRSITSLETAPKAVAAVRRRNSSLQDLLAASPDLVVVGEDIQDPGNVGTMVRICCAAGFASLILCGASADAYNPKAVRAAAGAILHCRLVRCPDSPEPLLALKGAGYRVVATLSSGGVDYSQVSFPPRVALLFGNEGRGLKEPTLSMADLLIHIPISPLVESLNVASSCAILLYQALQQKRSKVL